MPIYGKNKKEPISTSFAVELILGDVPENILCSATPVYVDKNREFLVNTSNFPHWKDIRADTIPKMKRSGTKTVYYNRNNNTLFSTKNASHTHEVKRFIYKHDDCSEFHKVIIGVWQFGESKPLPYFYVQYYFEGPEQTIKFSEEQISRNKTKSTTKYSVKDQIKKLGREGMKGK